jgi:hypothetical protein
LYGSGRRLLEHWEASGWWDISYGICRVCGQTV